MARTSLGTLALAAGSIDDVMAWCVLAVVLASFQSQPEIAVMAIGGGALFAVFCLLILRRLLRPLGAQVAASGEMGQGTLVSVLVLVTLGAWLTDSIQIYAVFGAFLMGLAMPRGKFAAELHRHIYPLTTALLLPCFFVYSGLNTKIGLVNTPKLWLLAGLVLVAATVGKGVACYTAARQRVTCGCLANTAGGDLGGVIVHFVRNAPRCSQRLAPHSLPLSRSCSAAACPLSTLGGSLLLYSSNS